MKKKPKWGKPKLIVIARGDKQEGVLTGCKVDKYGGGGGYESYYNQCEYTCGEACAALVTS